MAKNNHYINNDSFKESLIEFNKTNIADDGSWLLRKNKIKEDTKLNKMEFYAEKNNAFSNMTEQEISEINERHKQARERVGLYFLKICDGLLSKKNFSGYSHSIKADMKSNALYSMLTAAKKIDLNRSNPFAYFTSVANNAYKEVLNNIKNFNQKNLRLNLIYNL